MKKLVEEKAHFYIVREEGICGESPVIRGTRVSVASIAEYYLMGFTPEEIQRELPHLTLSQIFDALSYYFDHREEIDKEIERNREEFVSKDYPPCKY